MHTSWSEIDTARQCLHKHHLAYREGWVSLIPPKPLRMGSGWHAAMEGHYAKEMDNADDMAAEAETWYLENGVPDDYIDEEISTIQWMADGYLRKWGKKPQWHDGKIVAVELEIYQLLPDVGMGDLYLKGFVDLIVEQWGKLWVVDHKSGRYAPAEASLTLADQWTLYVWALKEMGYEISGSMHNYAKTDRLKRIQTLEERFSRTPIYRTDTEIKSVVEEATVQAWQAKVGLAGNPRSPGDHCRFRCSFEDVCVTGRRYGQEMADNVLLSRHFQSERRINEYAEV